ncbi:MAG: MFS transporter [Marmoricola sp.]
MSIQIAPARWSLRVPSYPLVMALLGVSLGVSGVPAPLYGVYQGEWHLAPITTTVIFAVYALGALGGVLLAGPLSDRWGRKPLLVAALVGMVIGLVVFMTAQNVLALVIARTLHGASVGTAVVTGAATLLDLKPEHGPRNGHLTGIVFNSGMATSVLGVALLAQYAPAPLVMPYAIVSGLVAVLLLGVLAMVETHDERGRSPMRIARPTVPVLIRGDFWFAALGAMASWSVLGVYLSLFPAYAAHSTGIHGLVFGGLVVAAMAGSAAIGQALWGSVPAQRAAVLGDVAMAIALVLGVLALDSHQPAWVLVDAAALGAAFGLAFGGSLRHLGQVVPADRRGETMSAFYLCAYSAMAVPTLIAGWAATRWGVAAIFPWFSGSVALACLAAALVGMRRRA